MYYTISNITVFYSNIDTLYQSNNIYLRKNNINYKKLIDIKKFSSLVEYNNNNNNKNLLPVKIVGENKHYPPANKEWSNSVYTYNKRLLRALPAKDNMLRKTIKHYFFLSNCKDLARSRRMRSLIRKSTVEKLFVGKPEIKQTGDKIIVTIYTFDRERQFLLKNIYFDIRKLELIKKINGTPQTKFFNSYENWRTKFSLKSNLVKLRHKLSLDTSCYFNNKLKNTYLSLIQIHNNSEKTYTKEYNINAKLDLNPLKRKRMYFFKKSSKKNRIKRQIPYSGIKLSNETRFLRYTTRFNKNNIQARKRVYYAYLKQVLHMLGIQVQSFETTIETKNGIDQKNLEKLKSVHSCKAFNYSGKILLFFKGSSYPEVLSLDNIRGNLSYIDKVNLLISNFLYKIFSKHGIAPDKLSSFFVNFSKENFREFLSDEYELDFSSKEKENLNKVELDRFKKELSLISNYINLKINRFKFSNYLPTLKLMISKIYSKKVGLNIINLKYLHLNTDIFTEAIATKLRRKVSLLKVVRKSLTLAKTPSEFKEKPFRYGLNNMQSLDIHKSLELASLNKSGNVTYLNRYEDNLQSLLNRLYPRSFINTPNPSDKNITEMEDMQLERIDKNISTKVVSVLNSIRYKWVAGVKLETAGRLTRRYTASRSVFKFRYKGSLRDTDYSRTLDFLKKSMPVVKLRNQVKANSQYTFTRSKRRIGAFGIKGWISSY